MNIPNYNYGNSFRKSFGKYFMYDIVRIVM